MVKSSASTQLLSLKAVQNFKQMSYAKTDGAHTRAKPLIVVGLMCDHREGYEGVKFECGKQHFKVSNSIINWLIVNL